MSTPRPDGGTPARVILDCDTRNEIDDQFAIAYALGSPDLEVLGVISVHNTVASGKDSVDEYVREARLVADLCGRPDLPCLAGARGPMETPTAPVASEGLEFLAEQARIAPLTVLATGPITDIASFALLHPDLVDRIRVVWAGAFPDEDIWTMFRLGELNARADIAAWRALYASDVDLTVLPGWPNVARVSVGWREWVARLRGLRAPIADHLAQITAEYCDGRFDPTAGFGSESKILWDVVNVAAMRDLSWVSFETRDLPTLDAAGAPDYSTPSRRAEMLVDLDADAILADLWSVLETLPRESGAASRG